MSTVLEVKNLVKKCPSGKKGFFSKPAGYVHAVDDVSLKIEAGQTLGVVGESGCGKSTLGRVMTHLLPTTSGQVLLNGKDVTFAKGEELNQMRRTVQMIFQDPYSSLNPRHTVGRIVEMPLLVQKINPPMGRKKKVQELLELVGLRAIYDFAVVCDESNNTPSRIDRNELYLDIAIEPVKAIEFIYIPLRLLNTGELQG